MTSNAIHVFVLLLTSSRMSNKSTSLTLRKNYLRVSVSRSDPDEKVLVDGVRVGGAGGEAVVARDGAALQVRVVDEGPADAHSPEGVCEGLVRFALQTKTVLNSLE